MMRTLHTGSGWMIGLLLGAVCMAGTSCKKEDHDPPAVALSAPTDGHTVVADSEFVIAGVASDDQGLGNITATLYESFSETVIQTKTISISGRKQQFSFAMPAGDRYTASGSYTLRVTAADAAGNLGSAFTQVTVQALPLAYLGVIWAGDQGAGNFALHFMDTLGVVHAGPSGLASLSDVLADNRNRQWVTVQAVPGTLHAWDVEDFSSMFQVDLPQGTGAETYSGLSMNRSHYFASLKVPNYLRSYRFDGSPVNATEQALHPGTAILALDDHVYMGLQGVLGTPMKLDMYDAAGEVLQATQLLDWPVESVLALNADHILVCGNFSGQGQVLVLNRQSLARVQESTLSGSFIGAATANGRAWILSDQGLQEYFPTNGTLSALLVSGTYGSVGVDATRNRLFLGGTDQVMVFSGAGALLSTVNGTYGAVKFIDTRYNR